MAWERTSSSNRIERPFVFLEEKDQENNPSIVDLSIT